MTKVKSSSWSKRRALQEKDPTEVYEVARSIQERTVRRSKEEDIIICTIIITITANTYYLLHSQYLLNKWQSRGPVMRTQ